MNSILRACVLIVIASASALRAQVPPLINYQGRMVVSGLNFNGTGQFKFALVNGTGSTTFWSNDGTSVAGSQPTAAVSITVTKGLYSVLLGDNAIPNMMPVPVTAFATSDVRLRIWFNDGTNGSQLLTPDERLGAVPYAMVAATVPDGSITAAKLATGSVGSQQLGVGTISGLVGCNTTNPTQAVVFVAGQSVQAFVGTDTGSGFPYQLTNVPAGTVTVTARLATGQTASQQVNLTAGQTLSAVNFPFSQTFYQDSDGDGYGNPSVSSVACTQPATYVTNNLDFNDTCAACYPGAPEICDTKDNNNNGQIDEGFNLMTDVTNCGSCGNVCNDGLSCTNDVCSAGACTFPIQAGTCKIAGVCYSSGQPNGANACQICNPSISQTSFSNSSVGTVCGTPSCSGSTLTTFACNGTGTCGSSGSSSCSPYVCASSTACRTSCTVNTDCVAGFTCAAGGVCKLAQGQTCSSNSQCASGFCTDGVCCASLCGGVCEKCNLSGQLGSCAAVPINTDPDNECTGGSGFCNGARACF